MNRLWSVEKSCFQKNVDKNFDLENFRSKSSSRSTSCIGNSRFRARVAEGRPASRDHITGGNLESRIVYRGVGADFEKPKKYFRLIINRVAWIVEKSGFQKNLEKFLF